jgi:hypothetical protein
MRSKNSIAPEKLLASPVKSQFKLSYSYSHLCASIITGLLILEVFYPVLFPASSSDFRWIIYFVILIVSFFLMKKYTDNTLILKLDYEGLYIKSFHHSFLFIRWQDNISIKYRRFIGINFLILRKSKYKAFQFAPCLYGLSEILQSVKYYAGEDHPLVYALEKELTRPQQRPDKFLWQMIGVIAISLSIWLIGGNLVAAQMEKPLNEAISDYKQRHPQTPPNQSAIDLQTLMAKLGVSYDFFGYRRETENNLGKQQYSEINEIKKALSEYLEKQFDRNETFVDLSEAPLIEILPAKILNYLKKYENDLVSIKNLLINNPLPVRGVNGKHLDDLATNGHPNSILVDGLDLNFLHNLIVVDIINKYQLHNVNFSNELLALNKVKQVTQEQSSYIWQLINLIHESRIARLVVRIQVWG